MNDNQRFSILTFPQHFDGNELSVNIVVLPRDQNPLSRAIEQEPPIPDAPPFAEAKLKFTASIFSGFSVFPHNFAPISDLPLTTTTPSKAPEIFKALASQLDIKNLNTTNRNIDLLSIGQEYQPETARPEHRTVRKYLPKSYRSAFNFTTPRHKNAVTDNSYHCAIKGGEHVPTFKRSGETISWGKVYAYLMRQPLLATQAGIIYHTKLKIDASYFKDGGWLYIDLADDSDYRKQLDIEHHFVKRYAARIPPLTLTESRQVFAPLQFPVLYKTQATDPDPVPASNYDKLFIEAAEYDDGYAKIVHCQQPPNRDLLLEENDGAHPVKDVGIRLGWDDEQILIWYIRQLLADPSGELSGRIDAPLGVFGYCIDVRETAEPENPWETLNQAESKLPLTLTNTDAPTEPIPLGKFSGELPYQVYPMQVDGQKDESYWLPMYFASWNGHSMVLPDEDAANIYQTTNTAVEPDPEDSVHDTGTGVSGPAKNQLNQIYQSGKINTELRYGNNYEFRIRMQDLSGGAPGLDTQPINETASDIVSCRFKRYISPNQPRILEMLPSGNDDNILVNNDSPNKLTELNIQRPKLGYPAVIYTDKYTNPIQRLIDQAKLGIDVDPMDKNKNAEHRVGLGIADPDVDRIEIIVEIASLSLDKLNSVSGKDDYIHLYTTTRPFSAINNDDDYESVLNVPIEYRDVNVLHTGDELDLTNDFNLDDDIDNLAQLVLPTARTVRLTIRAVCEEKADNHHYYGFINDSDKRLDNRYGEAFQLKLYSPSVNEEDLLIQYPGVPTLQGIFMQPDAITAFDGKITTLLLGKKTNEQTSNVQLLADQLKLTNSKLTLAAPKGERVVFGCSSRIRHSLAPDNSSLTFASKGDLFNHWLCCISFEIDRDWMWDALEYRSFKITRTRQYSHPPHAVESNVVVGDIEMVRTASFESLHNPQRNSTRIVFIDVVEPKKEKETGDPVPGFPDTIDVTYTLEPQFKPGHAQQHDDPHTEHMVLPITTTPAQVPKIVSAGIALSPYVRNEIYSSTESRKRYLWVEFAEPVKDPNDIYFARVLANAPDQLISNNDLELLAAPEEPALPIDPEIMRVITEDSSNDLAGLNAMQPMEKSTSSDFHYLLPLPPGLHANADEMFGFFTYEFRLGHYRNPETDEMVWTTAQGRFGRRLRVTGMQHPAPALTCMTNRDKKKLWVTAPYAVAVHDGKNVTANPPRTQLWALLYAQVKQADNKDYRNILLDDRQLDWRIQVEPEKDFNVLEKYDDEQMKTLKTFAFNNFKYEVNATNFTNELKLVDYSKKNKDAKKYGTTVWLNKEIAQLLENMGLPQDSPLSALVVETLPHITNLAEHIPGIFKPSVAQVGSVLVATDEQPKYYGMLNMAATNFGSAKFNIPSPVSDELGEHRILRTSPLTEVDGVCVEK